MFPWLFTSGRECQKNWWNPNLPNIFYLAWECLYARCFTIKGFPRLRYFTLIIRSVWKISNLANCTFGIQGFVLRRLMEQRSTIYFIVNNLVFQYCSYRPREMSSKKPVSQLRQVIPVKKRVSHIVFAVTKAYNMYMYM